MFPGGESPVQRPRPVLVQRFTAVGDGGLEIAVVLFFPQRLRGEEGDGNVPHRLVPGKSGVFAQSVGQPHQIVGAAGAHAMEALSGQPVPPVKYIALLKLAAAQR